MRAEKRVSPQEQQLVLDRRVEQELRLISQSLAGALCIEIWAGEQKRTFLFE